MAGLYIHIPFCRKACTYCNFHFSTVLSAKPVMVDSIIKELHYRSGEMPGKEYLGSEIIESIYFGGGTPSLLTEEELNAIFGAIRRRFSVSAAAEITFEINPDDLNNEQLQSWRSVGVNRLSIGIQSFFDEDLVWMNRAHNAMQARKSIENVRAAGFDNFSIDLIYGGPTLSDEKWAENLSIAIAEDVPHLSCYALTVEPSTALDAMIRRKKTADVDPERQARQFLYMSERLTANGYEHYEISNLARPGLRSRHNTSYWQGKHYLGIGPSAHSFNGSSRQWNISNNAKYIAAIQQGIIPAEIEILTPVQQENEYIMTALRTIEGVDLRHVRKIFGEAEVERLRKLSRGFLDNGRVVIGDDAIRLTPDGKLFADGIASALFAEG